MTEFNLVYQAKTKKDEMVSLEALLRPLNGMNTEEYVKQHPSPIQLDMSVIEKVIEEIIIFKIPLPISINVSYFSFVDEAFIQFCLAKINNLNITLELTEYNKVHDISKLKKNIERLQSNKIKISLDDFGKDFSNVSLLISINFDQVKIDKSIIDNIDKNYLSYKHLSFLTEKIKNFGITEIVYEGVETFEQENLIKIFNANSTTQGYLHSKPQQIEMYSFSNTTKTSLLDTRKTHHPEDMEKLVYDLVLSKNKTITNDAIRSIDAFKSIFNHDYNKTISNFSSIFYNQDDDRAAISSIFHIMNNNERMIVIRCSNGIVIYENKQHEDFFGKSSVGRKIIELVEQYPDYVRCVNDDRYLINSDDFYSVKKEVVNDELYFTIRQKINLNNEFFVITTIYEEKRGVFINKDTLTNCLLRDSIERFKKSGTYNDKVIAFLDVNGFKLINDNHGHHVGDNVLLTIVDFLNRDLRNVGVDDQLIRFGGDEFVILFNSKDLKSIEIKLQRINSEVQLFFKNKNMSISFSYGLEQNDSSDLEKSILLADKKMYIQKQMHKKHAL